VLVDVRIQARRGGFVEERELEPGEVDEFHVEATVFLRGLRRPLSDRERRSTWTGASDEHMQFRHVSAFPC
jgi:hypothetical protein